MISCACDEGILITQYYRFACTRLDRDCEPTNPRAPDFRIFRIQHASASARALFQRARSLRYIIKGCARVLLLRRGGCACTFESRYLFKDCARVRFFLCVCVCLVVSNTQHYSSHLRLVFFFFSIGCERGIGVIYVC